MKKPITTVGLMIAISERKRMVSFWRGHELPGKHFWPSLASVGRFLRVVDKMHQRQEIKTAPNRDGWQAEIVPGRSR